MFWLNYIVIKCLDLGVMSSNHVLIFDLILIVGLRVPCCSRVGGAGHQSVVSNSYAYGDYYSDLESFNEDKPPNRYAYIGAGVELGSVYR